MTRCLRLLAIFAVLALPVCAALAAGSPSDDSRHERQPKLAVVISAEEAGGQNRENLEDLLMIELANQPFLQLVDRNHLGAIMKNTRSP